MNRSLSVFLFPLLAVMSFGILPGCMSGFASLPQANEIVAPVPRFDNQGEYLSPFTEDGTVALWVDKGVNASSGAAVGSTVGAFAGQQVLGKIPFVGGLLGSKVGGAIGRKAAISGSGGWEYIRETSDLSFDSESDLAVYIYSTHSTNEHYGDAMKATWGIYPSLQKNWNSYIKNAPRKPQAMLLTN